MREKLPTDRTGVTQKFTIFWRKEEGNGDVAVLEVDIYLTANTYPDGRLGELFIHIGKAGHTEAIYNEWAKSASRSLQHGIPVDELFRQHVGTLFAPDGATSNKDFPRCTSVLDLVSRWILSRYGSSAAREWIASMQHKDMEEEEAVAEILLPPPEEPAAFPTRWDLGAWDGAETMVEEKRKRSDGR